MTMPEGVVMQSTSPEGEALIFLRQYAVEHEYFTADQACDAYKASGGPEPTGGKGWRDKWGVLMKRAEQSGWLKKAGKTPPTSAASHATTTVLWMSNLYKGERTLLSTSLEYCKYLRSRWVMRAEKDLLALLMKAHDHGYEQGIQDERDRAKEQHDKAEARKAERKARRKADAGAGQGARPD